MTSSLSTPRPMADSLKPWQVYLYRQPLHRPYPHLVSPKLNCWTDTMANPWPWAVSSSANVTTMQPSIHSQMRRHRSDGPYSYWKERLHSGEMNSWRSWTTTQYSHQTTWPIGQTSWSSSAAIGWIPMRGKNVMKVTYTTIFAPFFLTFSISLPLRGGMWHYKGTLLQHSQALWPSQLSQSIRPYWLTWHYQDYDVNYDDSGSLLSCYSMHFHIQCGLPWLAYQ